MSRGIGRAQHRLLQTLLVYENVGASLQWDWFPGHTYWRPLATERDIEAYRTGRRVEVWMLLRDLTMPRAQLSRTLKALYRRGYVWLYGADLDHLDQCSNVKFV
jgi:hypothetical protein